MKITSNGLFLILLGFVIVLAFTACDPNSKTEKINNELAIENEVTRIIQVGENEFVAEIIPTINKYPKKTGEDATLSNRVGIAKYTNTGSTGYDVSGDQIGQNENYNLYWTNEILRLALKFDLSAINDFALIQTVQMKFYWDDQFSSKRAGDIEVRNFNNFNLMPAQYAIDRENLWKAIKDNNSLYDTYSYSVSNNSYTSPLFAAGQIITDVQNALASNNFGIGLSAKIENSTGALAYFIPYQAFTTNNSKLIISFTIPRYSLSKYTDGSGTVTVTPNPGSDGKYDAGTTVLLQAIPSSGWRFKNWSGASNATTSSINITMDQNKSITANFELIPRYSITTVVNPSGSGSISLSPAPGADGKYEVGTLVTATATASSGWQFEYWSGASNSQSNQISFTVNSNTSLAAKFILQSPITGPNGLMPLQSGTYSTSFPGASYFKWSRDGVYLGTGSTKSIQMPEPVYQMVITVDAFDSQNNVIARGRKVVGQI